MSGQMSESCPDMSGESAEVAVKHEPSPSAAPQARVVGLKRKPMMELLGRLGNADESERRLIPEAVPAVAALPCSVEHEMNAAIGCKTSEVTLQLLAEVIKIEKPDFDGLSEDKVDAALAQATAMLAELNPANATEALLAAQVVGTHRLAMKFMASAVLPGQVLGVADSHILKAIRLMRLYNEQLEAMSKLKGKAGHQRVVVEHVTVAAGGQAIVGAVTQGEGGGQMGAIEDEPHAPRRAAG